MPDSFDRDIYLVLDDFGDRLGWAWPETDVADTDRATVIRHLLDGQYSSPVRIVAFNPAEGWSRDVTDDIAAELAKHAPIVTRYPHRLRTSSPTTQGRAECADGLGTSDDTLRSVICSPVLAPSLFRGENSAP